VFEYLETGRAIFWSQVLHLRSFDQLRDDVPQQAELKDRLSKIATALELGSFRETLPGNVDNRQRMASDEEASRLSNLTKKWSEVLDHVRRLDGFEDFLLPRSFSSLQISAKVHPVIILIPNDDGSDCLIMTSTDLHHISLPQLFSNTLEALVHLTALATSQVHHDVPVSHIQLIEGIQAILTPDFADGLRGLENSEPVERAGGPVNLYGKRSSDDCFRQVLEFLWKELVKPIVDYLKLQVRCPFATNCKASISPCH